MKKYYLSTLLAVLCSLQLIYGQSLPSYFDLVNKGDTSYQLKDYATAGAYYSRAADIKGYKDDGSNDFITAYNGACSWALAAQPGRAFDLLDKVSKKIYFIHFYEQMQKDEDFNSLKTNNRWQKICNTVKDTKDHFEAGLDKKLVDELDTIYIADQADRLKALDYEKKYGGQSAEAKAQWKIVDENDQRNQKKVTAIIDKYGWPGIKRIGFRGNQTVFLVIQHADLATQEKYLPILSNAVKTGNALAKDYAYMVDRVALRQGKKQTYGSQLTRDGKTGKMLYPSPLNDPDNVDKRRLEVGLDPMAQYLMQNGLKWDIAQYKTMLAGQEAKKSGNEK
jgi:hypothetical protein